MTCIEGSPLRLGWTSGEGKWPFHQKGNKCYRIKVQNNGKMKIDSERRAGGREEIELPWPRGEVSGGRRATKVALMENCTGWWSHCQDMGLRREVRESLWVKEKRGKKKGKKRTRRRKWRRKLRDSIWVACELYWDEEISVWRREGHFVSLENVC